MAESASFINSIAGVAAARLLGDSSNSDITDSGVGLASPARQVERIIVLYRSAGQITDVIHTINGIALGAGADVHKSIFEGAASGTGRTVDAR